MKSMTLSRPLDETVGVAPLFYPPRLAHVNWQLTTGTIPLEQFKSPVALGRLTVTRAGSKFSKKDKQNVKICD